MTTIEDLLKFARIVSSLSVRLVRCTGQVARSIGATADALEALLTSLRLGSVQVVGYSLGTRVALELCTRPGQPRGRP